MGMAAKTISYYEPCGCRLGKIYYQSGTSRIETLDGNQSTASMKHYHPCHADPQSPFDLPGLTFLPKRVQLQGSL